MNKLFLLSFMGFISILSLPVNSSGQKVGVGTATPAFKLDVKNGSINTDSVYRINGFSVLAISDPGNVFVGRQAGSVNIGGYNMFSGHAAGTANTSGSFNSFFGTNAGLQNTTGSNNSFFGFDAGFVHTTGWYNCFFGVNAGGSTSSGFGNSFFGYNCGVSNTTGYSNIAIGKDALFYNTVGHNNIAIGDSALYNQTAGFLSNFAIGSKAGYFNTSGTHNSFIGYQSGYSNTTGGSNTFAGSLSGYTNTTGDFNAFFGSEAGPQNTTGSSNAFFGQFAGISNTTGSNNCFIGEDAGSSSVSGSNLTMLGRGAGAAPTTPSLSYATAVGADAMVGCSNCLVLGGRVSPYGSQTRVGINNAVPLTDLHIIQQTDAGGDKVRGIRLQRSANTNHWRTLIDPSNNYIFEYNDALYSYVEPFGGSFVNPSDASLKKDITPLTTVLDKLMMLQPKTYRYIATADAGRHSYGFLAQDVEKLFPDFVFSSENGIKGIAYHNFSVIAIKAIQEQQEIIKALQIQVEAAKAEIPMQIGKQQEIIKTLQQNNEEQKQKIDQQQLQINEILKELKDLRQQIEK